MFLPKNQHFSENAFDGADALWKTFQKNLADYINKDNSENNAVVVEPKIDRPDWDSVRRILKGEIPASEIGC